LHTAVLTPQMSFLQAFELWISRRIIPNAGLWSNARYIAPRTERDLRQYAAAAAKFLGELPLGEIHAGHLREYQRARATCDKSAADWAAPAGAILIRKEVQTICRVLRAAGAWTPQLEEQFEPLQPVESDEVGALTPEEQHRWLHAASSRVEWQVVYWYSLVALQTTAATNEMRSLRIGDVFLDQGTLQIRREGAKNRARIRMIPLQTPEVAWALDALIDRASRLGAQAPHHYLFPFHLHHDVYDPVRPMTVWGLRKRWDEVQEAAKLPRFTPYHTRHTALTRMAEVGVPLAVAMSFAGHLSPKMQQRYVAISMAAKREWAGRTWTETANSLKKSSASVGIDRRLRSSAR
jgi:integrase